MSIEIEWQDDIQDVELWFTLYFKRPPDDDEEERLRHLLQCWYDIGFHGGFGGKGMHYYWGFEYDERENVAKWGVDMGTASDLAIDVLTNLLDALSREFTPVVKLVIGGMTNQNWDARRELGWHP